MSIQSDYNYSLFNFLFEGSPGGFLGQSMIIDGSFAAIAFLLLIVLLFFMQMSFENKQFTLSCETVTFVICMNKLQQMN